MTLNHSKSIKTIASLLCMPYQKGNAQYRDTTVLIDLLWFNAMHYSSLFQYFFWFTMVPFSVFFWKQLFWLWLKYRVAYYYWWTHAYHIKTMALCAPITSEKKMLHCLLCSTCYTAVQINDCLKESVQWAASMKAMDDKSKPSHAYHKIKTFHSEQWWMGYKEGHW